MNATAALTDQIAAYIAAIVESAPPPTAEQLLLVKRSGLLDRRNPVQLRGAS